MFKIFVKFRNFRYLMTIAIMPHRWIRAHDKHIWYFEGGRVIELKEADCENQRIARHFGRRNAAIRRCGKSGSTTTSLSMRTAAVDLGPWQDGKTERLLDQLSVHQIRRYQAIWRVTRTLVFNTTIDRRLKERNILPHRLLRRLPLTPKHH